MFLDIEKRNMQSVFEAGFEIKPGLFGCPKGENE